MQQLVSSVQCCHLKGIIYRDLKPENMLFDAQRKVKIVDFGLSTQFSGSKLSAVCGSLPFAGPDLFLSTDCGGPAMNAWSLGVVLCHIIIGTPALEGNGLLEAAAACPKWAIPAAMVRLLLEAKAS